MPHALQHRAAATRAELTEETLSEATAGLQRPTSHGLDHCDPGQRRLRCLLALGLFNAGPIGASPAAWHAHVATCYTLKISPRYRLLKVVTGAPENVAGRLLPTPEGYDGGLPGLRLAAGDWDSCLLRHVPTGAELLITRRRDARRPIGFGPLARLEEVCPVDVPLSRYELMALDSVPPISADAAVLLGALVSRLNVTDREARWATGMWDADPLLREREWGYTPLNRQLWGAGDHWDLRWQGYPRPTDLLAALTDPRIAVEGIEVSPHRRHCFIARRGSADLTFGWLD